MDNINFIKNIDNLGRIVIPMDVRRKLQINTGDVLSITCSDKEIMLSKYSSLKNNNKIIDIINVLIELYGFKLILMDRDSVVYSNVVGVGKLSNDIKINMNSSNKCMLGSLKFLDMTIDDYYSRVPIITNEGVIGSIILIGNDENLYTMCEFISKVINIELNIT